MQHLQSLFEKQAAALVIIEIKFPNLMTKNPLAPDAKLKIQKLFGFGFEAADY